MSRAFSYASIASPLAMLMISSCSLEPQSGDSSIYVDLSALARAAGVASLTNAAYADFACIAMNVTGPGIEDSDPYRLDKNPAGDFAKTLSGSACAYRGIVSAPIFLSNLLDLRGEISLKIPPGPVRMVQLVGVKSQESCLRGLIDPPALDNDENYYELGRAEVRDLVGDRSVDLALVDWGALTLAQQNEYTVSCDSTEPAAPIDTVAPVLTMSPFPTLITNPSFSVSGITVSESISHYCVLVNSANAGACSWQAGSIPNPFALPMSDSYETGVNMVTVFAKDAAGNVGSATSTSFEYDSPSRLPLLSTGQINAVPGAAGQINVTLAPGPEYFSEFCVLDSAAATPLTPGSCVWYPKGGTHAHGVVTMAGSVYIHVFVRDSHGNISGASQSTVVGLINVGM